MQFDAVMVNRNKYAICFSSINLLFEHKFNDIQELFGVTTGKNGDAKPFGI